MGSQRRIAEVLMQHFLLTEEQAWDKIKYIEAIGDSVCDELAAAIFPLLDEGDLEQALRDIREVRDRLNNSILNLQAAFTGVEKRRQ